MLEQDGVGTSTYISTRTWPYLYLQVPGACLLTTDVYYLPNLWEGGFWMVHECSHLPIFRSILVAPSHASSNGSQLSPD